MRGDSSSFIDQGCDRRPPLTEAIVVTPKALSLDASLMAFRILASFGL